MFQDAPYHPASYAGLGAKPSANMVGLCKRDARCLVDEVGGCYWWGKICRIATFRTLKVRTFLITFEKNHCMFIVVYKEGSQYDEALIKETFAQAKALETDKYVFSWEGPQNGYELYEDKGILCYNEDGQPTRFRHGKYTLTHITKGIYKNSSDWNNLFEFIFRYDNSKDVVIKSISTENCFPRTFSNAIKDILHASKFNSWEEYQKNKVNEREIHKLKAENTALKKENEELKQKLTLQNRTP